MTTPMIIPLKENGPFLKADSGITIYCMKN